MAYDWLPVSTTLIQPCLVRANSNIVLAGLQLVDGVDLNVNDRVLVMGQTNPVQNGVYVAAEGPWQRAADFGGNFAQLGSRVYVVDGYGPGSEYAVTTENPVIGVTPIEFVSVQQAIFNGLLPDNQDAAPRSWVMTNGPGTYPEWQKVTKADVGLGEADNTSDLNKPLSLAFLAQKGAANGVATLDGTGKVPNSQIPSLSIVDVYTVDSEAEQLALDAQNGDVAVRTDQNKSYAFNGGTAGTMDDWTWLRSPTDVVLSVAGRTGSVVLTRADVGLANAAEKNVANEFTQAQTVSVADTNAQLNLKRTGASAGGGWIGASDTDAFNVYKQNLTGGPLLRLSHNGQLRVPNNPAFYAVATPGNVASVYPLTWTSIPLNRGGAFSTNGLFTAPIDGAY